MFHVPLHHTHLHSTSFRSNSHFSSFRVPLNRFVSPNCQALPTMSLHVPKRSLTFWSTSDRWLLHCTHCFSVCLTQSLIDFVPSGSPSFSNAFRCVFIHLYTYLHVVCDFHQHPTACSVFITSCLPLFHPLINSTPTTTTLGVVTWKLGIVLRPSGALFPAHLTKAPTVSIPAREGEEDKLKA